MKKARISAALMAAVIFIASGAMILHHRAQDRETKLINDSALETAGISQSENISFDITIQEPGVPMQALTPEPDPCGAAEENLPLWEPLETEMQYLAETDISALQQTNPDVFGWICIPGTEISYPLLQGADNQEYLNLAWDGSASAAGSIFLECKNQSDLSDYNTIIYGHHMRNGSMFADLINYSDEDYFEDNSKIYIVTKDSVHRYEIFAAYEAEVTSDTYRLYFPDEVQKQAFITHSYEQSIIQASTEVSSNDRFLTLSTCTGKKDYTTRWVVQAVLTGEFSDMKF